MALEFLVLPYKRGPTINYRWNSKRQFGNNSKLQMVKNFELQMEL